MLTASCLAIVLVAVRLAVFQVFLTFYAILSGFIQFTCWFHSLFLFLTLLTMSYVSHFSLIFVFLSLSFNLFPIVILRAFISVVLSILLVVDVSALTSMQYVNTVLMQILDTQCVLRCLFFQIGYLRCPDIAAALRACFLTSLSRKPELVILHPRYSKEVI